MIKLIKHPKTELFHEGKPVTREQARKLLNCSDHVLKDRIDMLRDQGVYSISVEQLAASWKRKKKSIA